MKREHEMHIRSARLRATVMGTIVALAGGSLHLSASAAPADQGENKFTWMRDTSNLINSNDVYYLVVQKRDGVWVVNSINDRKYITSADEETILARRQGQGWEFIPQFDLVDKNRGGDFQCIGKRPEGIDNSQPLERDKRTNICDSLLTTSTTPKEERVGRAVGVALATIFTGGVGGVVLALDKRTSFFPDTEELKRVVADTHLDELLNRIEGVSASYFKGAREIINRGNSIASRVKTRYVIKDTSMGFGKHLVVPGESSMVRYQYVFPDGYNRITQYPTSLDATATFARIQEDRLVKLGRQPVIVRGYCSLGDRQFGSVNVSLKDCPKELTITDEAKAIEVPLEVLGVKTEVRPTVQADDKIVRVQLTANGLVIENRSSDFVDIVDVAVSINGKVRTLSGGSAALITVPPQTTYPRDGDTGKFAVKDLMDQEMRASLNFQNLTAPEAVSKKVTTSMSVRYAVDGKQKTLRATSSATVLELLRL